MPARHRARVPAAHSRTTSPLTAGGSSAAAPTGCACTHTRGEAGGGRTSVFAADRARQWTASMSAAACCENCARRPSICHCTPGHRVLQIPVPWDIMVLLALVLSPPTPLRRPSRLAPSRIPSQLAVRHGLHGIGWTVQRVVERDAWPRGSGCCNEGVGSIDARVFSDAAQIDRAHRPIRASIAIASVEILPDRPRHQSRHLSQSLR